MITVIINRDIGMNIDNMPDNIFRSVIGIPSEDGNSNFVFHIDEQRRVSVTESVLLFATANRKLCRSYLDGENLVFVSEGATTRQFDLPIIDRATEEEENDDGEEDDEEDGFDPYVQEVTTLDMEARLEHNDILQAVAGSMENELSNQAKNLADRTIKFDRAWSVLLHEKRKIDEATSLINNHPIIRSLMEQVEELKSADNMIDDIYFTSSHIVILTKTLSTSAELNISRKEIGRMKISIGISPFIGSASKDSRPVTIKNMDRVVHTSAEESWQCGHVMNPDNICWGTAWEMLFTAFSNRDLTQVAEVLIRFITTPNLSDSWGACIEHFPEYHQPQLTGV